MPQRGPQDSVAGSAPCPLTGRAHGVGRSSPGLALLSLHTGPKNAPSPRPAVCPSVCPSWFPACPPPPLLTEHPLASLPTLAPQRPIARHGTAPTGASGRARAHLSRPLWTLTGHGGGCHTCPHWTGGDGASAGRGAARASAADLTEAPLSWACSTTRPARAAQEACREAVSPQACKNGEHGLGSSLSVQTCSPHPHTGKRGPRSRGREGRVTMAGKASSARTWRTPVPGVPRTPDHVPQSHGASAGKAQGMRVCAHENHTPTPCTHPKSRRHMGAAHNALTSPLRLPQDVPLPW